MKERSKSLAGWKWLTTMLTAFAAFFSLQAQGASDATGDKAIFTEAFQRFGVNEGLANNVAFDVAEDKYHFIWVTTRNGISKFDGSDFTVYRPIPPGVSEQVAQFYQTITKSRDGNLWFCSWGNGLLKLDIETEQFTFYRHDDNHPDTTIASNNVWFAFEDKDGMMWVSSEGGLSRLDPKNGMVRVYRHDPKQPDSLGHTTPTQVVQDKQGMLWVGTYGGGLDRLDPATGKFTHYRHDEHNPNSLVNDSVGSLFLDPDGTLWIATDGGLNHFDPASGKFTTYVHDPDDPGSLATNAILKVMRDSQGRLWTSHWGGGIHRMDTATGKFTHYRFDANDPLSVGSNLSQYFIESHDHAYWFSTFNGLARYDENAGRFRVMLQQPGLSSTSGRLMISGMVRDPKGRLWAATEDTGVLRYDPASHEYRHYLPEPGNPRSLSEVSITSIKIDLDGNIWLVTRAGLNRYDEKTDSFENFKLSKYAPKGATSDSTITDLTVDRHGVLWMSVYGVGLQSFDPKRKLFSLHTHDVANPHSLGSNLANTVLAASDGSVWVGADAGLSRFDPASGNFTNFTAGQDGLSSVIVNDLAEMPDGTILVATDVGVNRYDPRSGKFTAFTLREGMPSNYATAIKSDTQGNIWAGTDKGVVRIQPASGKIRVYDARDGLPSNQVWNRSSYRAPDGTLYFGTANGITAFKPEALKDNPTPPPVYITEFSLFNNKVMVGPHSPLKVSIYLTKAITLDYLQSSLSFRFAALNYRWPLKNQYAYQLEGFDKGWTYVDSAHRQAAYTNLPPGNYVFRVKASNNDGVWNEEGAKLSITITPPWWQTWWFRALMAVLTLTLAYAAYRMRVRQLKERARKLQHIVNERTYDLQIAKEKAEIASQAKSTFLASVSHELRTPLNAILGYAQILRRDTQHLTKRQASGLTTIHESGQHLLNLINDILDLARVEAGKLELHPTDVNLSLFLRVVTEIIRVKAEEKSLLFTYSTSPDLPTAVEADEKRLRQILLNLLGNAVKFTDHGEVSLRVQKVASSLSEKEEETVTLRIEIEDSGIGMTDEQLSHIFRPFEQVSEMQRREGGTGLGLSISLQLVRLMGGNIQVKSQQGKGSLFWFEVNLPVIASAIAEMPLKPIILGYQGPRRKVLIVDDVPQNRAMLLDALSSLGFEVFDAENGQECLDLLDSINPDLIVMDVMMPVMDGREATRRIRNLPKFSRIPIITASASATSADEAQNYAAGADAFLPKPIEHDLLLEIIGRLLSLTWIYPESAQEEGKEHREEKDDLVVPPADEMERLYHLAKIGIMQKICEQADYLKSLDPRYIPFAEQLQNLAENYQSKAIVALVEQYRSKPEKAQTESPEIQELSDRVSGK